MESIWWWIWNDGMACNIRLVSVSESMVWWFWDPTTFRQITAESDPPLKWIKSTFKNLNNHLTSVHIFCYCNTFCKEWIKLIQTLHSVAASDCFYYSEWNGLSQKNSSEICWQTTNQFRGNIINLERAKINITTRVHTNDSYQICLPVLLLFTHRKESNSFD